MTREDIKHWSYKDLIRQRGLQEKLLEESRVQFETERDNAFWEFSRRLEVATLACVTTALGCQRSLEALRAEIDARDNARDNEDAEI